MARWGRVPESQPPRGQVIGLHHRSCGSAHGPLPHSEFNWGSNPPECHRQKDSSPDLASWYGNETERKNADHCPELQALADVDKLAVKGTSSVGGWPPSSPFWGQGTMGLRTRDNLPEPTTRLSSGLSAVLGCDKDIDAESASGSSRIPMERSVRAGGMGICIVPINMPSQQWMGDGLRGEMQRSGWYKDLHCTHLDVVDSYVRHFLSVGLFYQRQKRSSSTSLATAV